MHDLPPPDNPVTEHITDQESDYWGNFYRGHEFDEGSSFCEFVNEQKGFPSTIIEFGCGNGRDSLAFANAGKQVVALDRSHNGIASAQVKAMEQGLGDSLFFAECDVSDERSLGDIIETVRGGTKGPIAYYMRFFLHSIPEDSQKRLMDIISEHAQEGDVFAAEFRTDKDRGNRHEFGDGHYRRYQNANDFSSELQGGNWKIESEIESTGLSPYNNEDPVLYRVIAKKSQSGVL